MDNVFHDELDLSTIDNPTNRMQRTSEVIEIGDQNLYGPKSNTVSIAIGGNPRPNVLHQVRDQILPDPELISECNAFRDNIGRGSYSEVNNPNLPGFNLIQDSMDSVNVRDSNYQSTYRNDPGP